MSETPYSSEFFQFISSGKDAYKALLHPVMAALKPKSVIDLGTGSGTWLAAAKDLGVSRVLGLDGQWAATDHQQINGDEFQVVDFETGFPDVGRFDLAISLEVLEHISPEAGKRAVRWLCERSDVVIFSAAIPGQGGTHHINEQWQSYWADKFRSLGFHAYDIIRPTIWRNSDIPWWYRQNAIVYARPDAAKIHGWTETDIKALDLVHPERFDMANETIAKLRRRSVKGRLRALMGKTPK